MNRVLYCALLLVSACRSPTEIELDIRTNLQCDKAHWKGVAVYLGKPGSALENSKDSTLVTDHCNKAGEIGTLVVTPSGADDALVGVRVVAGVTKKPEDCTKDHYDGCIVARRSLRFRPHETVPLDVTLTGDCVNIACDDETSCRLGSCAAVHDIAPTLPEPKEAGAKSVRCGDDGLRCATTGDVCCLAVNPHAGDAGTASGQCMPSVQCPPDHVVLNCDDDTDCAPEHDADGSPALCFISAQNGVGWNYPASVADSFCMKVSEYRGRADSHVGLALCAERTPCPRTTGFKLPCIAARGDGSGGHALPGYFWCEWDDALDPKFKDAGP